MKAIYESKWIEDDDMTRLRVAAVRMFAEDRDNWIPTGDTKALSPVDERAMVFGGVLWAIYTIAVVDTRPVRHLMMGAVESTTGNPIVPDPGSAVMIARRFGFVFPRREYVNPSDIMADRATAGISRIGDVSCLVLTQAAADLAARGLA